MMRSWLVTACLLAVTYGQQPGLLVDPIPPGLMEDLDIPGVLPVVPEEPLEPLVRCKRPMCPENMWCKYGLELGEDGCQICACKIPTREEVCQIHQCEEGYTCHMPTCEGELCASVEPKCIKECPLRKCVACASGVYLDDDHGCQTCQCGPMPCAMPMCALPCEYGYANDDNGCMTCDCNAAPAQQKECSKAMCRMYCEYGFQKDEDGCEICRCNECSNKQCLMFCEFGFEKNENGCEICRCKEPDDRCAGVDCPLGMACKQVVPLFGCDDIDCAPMAVCRPSQSLCELGVDSGMPQDELSLLLHQLEPQEEPLLFPGPTSCRPDGAFRPRQCGVAGECSCVDDRGVMMPDIFSSECKPNITRMMDLAFDLEHDMDDNLLDGAMEDIQKLVHEAAGQWMGVGEEVITTVQVVYIKPGQLMVEMTVIHNGLVDLPSLAHHLHKQMAAGGCQVHYKDHQLKPNHQSLHVKHHYQPRQVHPPTRIAVCYGYMTRHHPILMIILPIVIIASLLLIIITVCLCKKKKMTASYQFKHKKMENMENFKKNLILSSEWEKPELICSKDDVKVTLTDLPEESKPIA